MADYSNFSKDELIARILELESRQKAGLVWEEDAPESFELESRARKPVLAPITELSLTGDPATPAHMLIEGDNLHALTVLAESCSGSVDIIYIDPPYNTGNRDFRYKDSYTHSKWQSFMNKRLQLAKNLLKENGLLFISIDDNESAGLKLLCDAIFGEENFRNTIVVARVKKNIKEREHAKSLNYGHGMVLFYGASTSAVIQIPAKFQPKKERWHSFDAPGVRRTMQYELFGHRPPEGRHWMYEESRANELIAEDSLRPNPSSGKPEYRLHPSDHTMLDTNWTDLLEGDSRWILNGGKNTELIKRMVSMHPNKNALVLDFFAGSGSTAQAVIELNHEDGGSRRVILCTNNENEICTHICQPRIKGVIAEFGGRLDYYRTDFL